jgi:hypothetical protein
MNQLGKDWLRQQGRINVVAAGIARQLHQTLSAFQFQVVTHCANVRVPSSY